MSNSVTANVTNLWVYLSESALLWLAVTFADFLIGNTIFERSGRNPIANPQPIAAAPICVILSKLAQPAPRLPPDAPRAIAAIRSNHPWDD